MKVHPLIDVLGAPWAILPERLIEIRDIYIRHTHGPKLDAESIAAKLNGKNNEREPGYTVQGGTAVIEIEGVIGKKMNMFTRISGGTSSQILGQDFAEAMNDPEVHSIVLAIDSPGGTVDGTQALADQVFAARGRKPVVAIADGMMASAAYWIGSAADSVFTVGDTTAVGSIGVVATHTDYSQAEKAEGIKVTEITAGRYKRIASEHAPLSDEGRFTIQQQVDHLYSIFVDNVARHRGVDSQTVADGMADGKIFLGKQAMKAGLVDGVSTTDAIVNRLNQEHYDRRKRAVSQFILERKTSYERTESHSFDS